MNRLIKNIFIGFVSFSLISIIIVLGILWNYSNNIPDYKFLKSYKNFNKKSTNNYRALTPKYNL